MWIRYAPIVRFFYYSSANACLIVDSEYQKNAANQLTQIQHIVNL